MYGSGLQIYSEDDQSPEHPESEGQDLNTYMKEVLKVIRRNVTDEEYNQVKAVLKEFKKDLKKNLTDEDWKLVKGAWNDARVGGNPPVYR